MGIVGVLTLYFTVGCKDIVATRLGSDTSLKVAGFCALNHSNAAYCEDFETYSNGDPWPPEWEVPAEVTNAGVMLTADIQNHRGRLRAAEADSIGGLSPAKAVARIVMRSPSLQNIDALYTVEYENIAFQGIGFYGRQNGGWFDLTNPAGMGYAVFLEGFGTQQIGLWHENGAGSEIQYMDAPSFLDNPTGGGASQIQNGLQYTVRFQVEQINATTTRIRAKVWRSSLTEPVAWMVTRNSTSTDAPAALQNMADGYVFDLYNYPQGGASNVSSVYIDNIVINSL